MKIGVAVLAAGPGSRAGGCKLARIVCGRPLLEWSLYPAAAFEGATIRVIVVGACLCAVEKVNKRLLSMFRVIYNPWWREGMASSARIAATILEDAGVDVALFTLGDMPLVTRSLLEKLVSTLGEGWEAAYTSHGGVRGPPAAFRRE
ncbi:MAG: NTP transferase domain-containing protein, partial [Desulfurococcales archaeon]|nr:NTP transferase domain-containing protein [Desulfurococcales archaeon]